MAKDEYQSRSDQLGDVPDFALDSYFPYQVRIFYRAISQSVTNIYSTMFGLTVSEWRAMAVLGSHEPLSASDIVERSSIDKVNASRAIKGLQKRGLLERQVDPDDGRRAMLRLSPEGQKVFQTLVPLVQALENQLLEGLSATERDTLWELMNRVRMNAEEITRNDTEPYADEQK